MRLVMLLGLVLGLSPGLKGAPATPAMVLTLDGPVQWLDGSHWRPVELGQLFGPGDTLRCGPAATLLLALGDACSVALDPGTQVRLTQAGTGDGPGLELAAGRLDLLSDPAPDAPGFPVRTANALVRVLGRDVQVSAAPDDSEVCVTRGEALLGDPRWRVDGSVSARQRRRLALGRLWPLEDLSKRAIFALDDRWARAREFHAQRRALWPALLGSPDHARFLRALKQRQARR